MSPFLSSDSQLAIEQSSPLEPCAAEMGAVLPSKKISYWPSQVLWGCLDQSRHARAGTPLGCLVDSLVWTGAPGEGKMRLTGRFARRDFLRLLGLGGVTIGSAAVIGDSERRSGIPVLPVPKSPSVTPPRAADIPPPAESSGLINVRSYGARGNGVTDDGPAIRQALQDARMAGGGIVYVPPGTYLVSTVPRGRRRGVALVVGSKTMLLGAGRDATTIRAMPDQPDNSIFVLNYNTASGGDVQMVFQDFTFDGDASHQSAALRQSGIQIQRTRGVRFLRVRVMNVKGTMYLPPGEGFAFNCEYCTDTSYTDCETLTTAGTTAAGFSAGHASGLEYKGCWAYGMTHSAGFTLSYCRQVMHVNCRSYLNGAFGFNSEFSDDVIYMGCIAGGQAAAGPESGAGGLYPPDASLGNRRHGFALAMASRNQLVGCVARDNGGDGLLLSKAKEIRIIGGDFSANMENGIHVDTESNDFRLLGGLRADGNRYAALRLEAYELNSFISGPLPAPPMPRSGEAFANPFGLDATLYLSGGTVRSVAISGIVVPGPTMGPFRVPGAQKITITYTGTPTWAWFAD